MAEKQDIMSLVIVAGISLAIGGLVVGSLFSSAVTTFTDAFNGLAGTGNYTGATASVGRIVPVMWVLAFLGIFLGVFIGLLKKANVG